MWRGHKITEAEGLYRYPDGVAVRDDPARACGHCGLENTPAGHDGCIGEVPGAMNACCGHGVASAAYVQFNDGNTVRGRDALALFK